MFSEKNMYNFKKKYYFGENLMSCPTAKDCSGTQKTAREAQRTLKYLLGHSYNIW
jgi:hypothetical protein